MQSIYLKYPYDPRYVEHGPFPMILPPSPAHTLLIASEDYLTELKVYDERENKTSRTSHERSLLAIIYNQKKKQVIKAGKYSANDSNKDYFMAGERVRILFPSELLRASE